MPKVRGKGHQILSLLNIDYESYIKEIVDELMSFPDSYFTLSVKRKKP